MKMERESITFRAAKIVGRMEKNGERDRS